MIQKNNLSTLPLFFQRQSANWQKKADVWVHKDEPRKLYGKNLVAYKKTLKLTAQQNKILVGSLLGDGYIDFHRSAKQPSYYFCFAQTWHAADYVDHIYQIFKPFVGTPPKINKIGGIKSDLPKRYEVRFKTYAHEEFKYYYDLFYPEVDGQRKKRVPQNIKSILTAEGLAYWYMDDGTTRTYITGKKSYVISTQGFCYEDQVILIDALKESFGLDCGVHKDKTYFRVRF
uniref:Site-specific DNA endonuclease n=1 Tax=Ulva flexuosa TaxID=83791 RepID=A0A247ZL09_9CHLO|nr:site-specific DNA endonuclease [Ulva flexuosa]AQS79875.1 site-specific DNA endonuclease [Ulva flexuosa]